MLVREDEDDEEAHEEQEATRLLKAQCLVPPRLQPRTEHAGMSRRLRSRFTLNALHLMLDTVPAPNLLVCLDLPVALQKYSWKLV